MKQILSFIGLTSLALFYFQLDLKASRNIIAVLQGKHSITPVFFVQQTQDSTQPQAQTQTQPQPQTQTQTQAWAQTQTQTQPQPQTQYLYIGFPMKQAWQAKTNGPVIAQPQPDATSVFFVSKSGNLHRVRQEDGKSIWRTNVGDTVEEAFLLFGKVVYIGTTSGNILAFSAERGRQIWVQRMEGEEFYTRPVSDGKRLYFVSRTGSVICVDGQKGQPIWRFKTEGECHTSPFLLGNLLFVGCSDKNFYALDTAAGFVKWKYQADAPIYGSPVATEQAVLFGSEDGYFYALRIQDGTRRWRHKLGAAIRGVPLLYHEQDREKIEYVFVASFDNFLYCLKIKDGGKRWLTPSMARVYNRMHLDRALIFLAPFGNMVYGFDPHTGQRVGEFSLPSRVRSSPITTNDKLFVGLNDGRLLCAVREPPPPLEGEQTVPAQTQTQTQTQPQTQTQTEEDEEEIDGKENF